MSLLSAFLMRKVYHITDICSYSRNTGLQDLCVEREEVDIGVS